MAKVLVIDDDPSLLRALRLGLKAGGHEVVTAADGEQGISQTALDLAGRRRPRPRAPRPRRPGGRAGGSASGARSPSSSCRPAAPRTARWPPWTAGADDYVTKPFGMAELEARIRTAIRHRLGADEPPARAADRRPARARPRPPRGPLAGAPVDLTAKEFEVLAFLARHAGRPAPTR